MTIRLATGLEFHRWLHPCRKTRSRCSSASACPKRLRQAGLSARSPITGETVPRCARPAPPRPEAAIGRAQSAYLAWRKVPAPRRGEFVRLLGEELRAAKDDLGLLVTLEAGKVVSEGLGEVQEMIDICDFAVGLSRQLYGLTIATERAEPPHDGDLASARRLRRDLGLQLPRRGLVVECGARLRLRRQRRLEALREDPADRARRAGHRREDDEALRSRSPDRPLGSPDRRPRDRRHPGQDHRVPVVSATGSTRMGKEVGQKLAARFARAILELGGNNAAIVAPSADLDIALRGIAFAAMGTAGQRCTTLRRLIVHESVYDALIPKLIKVYGSVKIGDPREGRRAGRPAGRRGRLSRACRPRSSEAKAAGGKVHGGEQGRRSARAASMSAPPWSRCPRRPARSSARPSRRSSM
jgi:aldehyde dehydrogenase (NAD+)